MVEEGQRKMVMTLPEVPPSSSTSLPLHLTFPPSSPSSLDKMSSGDTDSTHYHQVWEPFTSPPCPLTNLWIPQTFSDILNQHHIPPLPLSTPKLHFLALITHTTIYTPHTYCVMQQNWAMCPTVHLRCSNLYISVCVCVCVCVVVSVTGGCGGASEGEDICPSPSTSHPHPL